MQALGQRRARALHEVCAVECRLISLSAAVDACVAANEDIVRQILSKMAQANVSAIVIGTHGGR